MQKANPVRRKAQKIRAHQDIREFNQNHRQQAIGRPKEIDPALYINIAYQLSPSSHFDSRVRRSHGL